jgi:hypothetical protein
VGKCRRDCGCASGNAPERQFTAEDAENAERRRFTTEITKSTETEGEEGEEEPDEGNVLVFLRVLRALCGELP